MDTTMQHLVTMPKVELHLHLEGALNAETILTLAERNGLQHLLPQMELAAIQQWFAFTDFYHFMDVNRTIKNLLRTEDDLAFAVFQVGKDLAAQKVVYAEITFTPYTHVHFLNKNMTIEMILNGLSEGRRQVRDTYGIELRWIFDIPRNRAFEDYKNGGKYVAGAAERTLEFALMGREHGVRALGLGGSEVNAPPEPFAAVFARAKNEGLLSVPHAGESEGAASVRGAVEALQADRIGHGVRAIEDDSLVRLLAERQIPLEISLTSNLYLRFFENIALHPFPVLDKAGVMITLNTDDPPLFNTTLSQEYALLIREFGYSMRDVIRIARNGFLCVDPLIQPDLLAQFDGWVQANFPPESVAHL